MSESERITQLEAENARLVTDLRAFIRTLDARDAEITKLKAENARLRRLLKAGARDRRSLNVIETQRRLVAAARTMLKLESKRSTWNVACELERDTKANSTRLSAERIYKHLLTGLRKRRRRI